MRKRLWINSACVLAGLMLVGSAAATGCYVPKNKECCSILPPTGDEPETVGSCQDQIISNPVVPHYDNALLGTPGNETRSLILPASTCTWIDFAPSGEDCLPVGNGSPTSAQCIGVTIGGPACTGTWVPP